MILITHNVTPPTSPPSLWFLLVISQGTRALSRTEREERGNTDSALAISLTVASQPEFHMRSLAITRFLRTPAATVTAAARRLLFHACSVLAFVALSKPLP
jgi:hypothetical protein